MANLIKMTRKRRLISNLLSLLGGKFKLHRYEYSASMPNQVVSIYSEYGMIGCNDAKYDILEAADSAGLRNIRYWAKPVKLTRKTLDHYNKIFPDAYIKGWDEESNLYENVWWYLFGGHVYCYIYYLYFETPEDMTAFRIVR